MLISKEVIISITACIAISFVMKWIIFNSSPSLTGVNEQVYYNEDRSQMKSKLSKTKNYKVINIFKRKNPTVYTQGLLYHKSTIYESGGLYKKSTLTHMQWPSQKIIKKIELEKKYFAEGIAASSTNNILYQLTYKEREVLLYSFPKIKLVGKIRMPSQMREGWGMCPGRQPDEFFATDGSDQIFILKINKNNNELSVKSTLYVTKNMRPIYNLNELIYDGVHIYCNVYLENYILKINPNNGDVLNIYDMEPLINYEFTKGKLTKNRLYHGDVLNGITYIPEKKTFILTGKLWDYYYEIVFN